jgi:thymidine phosphorylase
MTLTPLLRAGRLAVRRLVRIDTGERLRFARLVALTLRRGWYAADKRSTGRSIQKESTSLSRKTLSAQAAAFGQDRMSCRGSIGFAGGTADGLAAVRMMRIRIRSKSRVAQNCFHIPEFLVQ